MGVKSRSLQDIAEELASRIDSPDGADHDVSNEPRVPKGSGRQSGEWTREESSQLRITDGNKAAGQEPFWPLPRPYNMCDHGYQGESCNGWVPGFLDDKPWLYMPTPDDLNRLSDEQKEFYPRYYEGAANAAAVASALQGVKGIYGGIRGWVLGKAGKAASDAAPTLDNISKAYRNGIKGYQGSRQ